MFLASSLARTTFPLYPQYVVCLLGTSHMIFLLLDHCFIPLALLTITNSSSFFGSKLNYHFLIYGEPFLNLFMLVSFSFTPIEPRLSHSYLLFTIFFSLQNCKVYENMESLLSFLFTGLFEYLACSRHSVIYLF